MDLNEIKQIIEIDGWKFIIVENGKPVMVITSFEEYKRRLIGKKEPKTLPAGRQAIPKELQEEELKLEDLPL